MATKTTNKRNWKKEAAVITEKLASNELSRVKEAIGELLSWVRARSKSGAELKSFGYEASEGTALIDNAVFDDMLVAHGKSLSEDDLFAVIASLLNGNDDYLDCRATLTAMRLLLESPTPQRQQGIVDAIIHGYENYEPGHRAYEEGLLDILVEEILPKLDAAPLAKLLTWAHDDLLCADNVDALFAVALSRCNDAAVETQIVERLRRYIKSNGDALAEKKRDVPSWLAHLSNDLTREELGSTYGRSRAAYEIEEQKREQEREKKVTKWLAEIESASAGRLLMFFNAVNTTVSRSDLMEPRIAAALRRVVPAISPPSLDGGRLGDLARKLASGFDTTDPIERFLIAYAFAHFPERAHAALVVAPKWERDGSMEQRLRETAQDPDGLEGELKARAVSAIEGCVVALGFATNRN